MGNVAIKNHESCSSSASSSSHKSVSRSYKNGSTTSNGQQKPSHQMLLSKEETVNSTSKLGALKEEEQHTNFLTEEEVRLVRSSWRELLQANDIREYGTIMMCK